jgi:hypothetical protein
MKTYSKIKTIAYQNITIQDENGIDTFKVRKDAFLSLFASHLRQIEADRTTPKA